MSVENMLPVEKIDDDAQMMRGGPVTRVAIGVRAVESTSQLSRYDASLSALVNPVHPDLEGMFSAPTISVSEYTD